MEKVTKLLISYHSNNGKWKDLFCRHCEPYREKGELEIIPDEISGRGKHSNSIVDDDTASFDVAFLIISKDYLSLSMVENGNIAVLISSFNHHGVKVVPVHAEHCEWQKYPWITQEDLWPVYSNTLSDDWGNQERLNRLVSELIRNIMSEKRDTDNNPANEKSIRNLIRLTEKKLKDLRIHNQLSDPKLNEAFRRAKPKRWDEFTEEEQKALAKEQAEAKQEFVREQRILRIKKFFQSIMKAKCDEPNSRLFITAEELLEFIVKYESNPSSVSNHEWNRFESILLPRLESLLQADGKEEEEPTETERDTIDGGDTYHINAEHVSLGDKAQHAGGDINTIASKRKKEKGGWGKKISVGLFGLAAIATILAVLFGDNIWGRISKEFKSNEPTPSLANPVNNANTEDETAKATEKKAKGIRARMRDIISGEFKRLIKKQVERWGLFNSGKAGVKTFDGKSISFSGDFANSSIRIFFWEGYIEPFIEDVIKRKIEETVELAKDKKVPISKVLGSTKANLWGGIDTTYHKMQEVDRRLRGGGYPKSVPKRDVSFEVKKMNDFLDRQIKIAEDLHFEIHKTGEVDKY